MWGAGISGCSLALASSSSPRWWRWRCRSRGGWRDRPPRTTGGPVRGQEGAQPVADAVVSPDAWPRLEVLPPPAWQGGRSRAPAGGRLPADGGNLLERPVLLQNTPDRSVSMGTRRTKCRRSLTSSSRRRHPPHRTNTPRGSTVARGKLNLCPKCSIYTSTPQYSLSLSPPPHLARTSCRS